MMLIADGGMDYRATYGMGLSIHKEPRWVLRERWQTGRKHFEQPDVRWGDDAGGDLDWLTRFYLQADEATCGALLIDMNNQIKTARKRGAGDGAGMESQHAG